MILTNASSQWLYFIWRDRNIALFVNLPGDASVCWALRQIRICRMVFSSLNNSETIRVKNSFYLKCVYLMCLVLNSVPCACILVVYVYTHGSNLWGISFKMHILDTCIKLKKLISCSFWFSVAGDQTQCLTHGIQVPYPWGIIPTLESLWKDFY